MASTDFRSLTNIDFSRNRLVNAGLEQIASNPLAPILAQIGFWTGAGADQNHMVLNLDGANTWARLAMPTQAETITGLWTFSRSGAPFAVGAGSTGVLVSGLNAERLFGFLADEVPNDNTIAKRYTSGRLRVGTPSAADDAVTKAYADTLSNGNRPVLGGAVRVATVSNFPGTYSSATKKITASANNPITVYTAVFDGLTLVLNDRVLVKNQTSTFANGIYYVQNAADLGSAGTPVILTRTSDADEPSEVTLGATVVVLAGALSANSKYRQSQVVANVDTDPEIWVLDSVTNLVAGPGIIVSGNKISFAIEAGYNAGDLFYADNGTPSVAVTRLGISGSSGKFLSSDGSKPIWASLTVPTLPTLKMTSSDPAKMTISPVPAQSQTASPLEWTFSILPAGIVSFGTPNSVSVGISTPTPGTATTAIRTDATFEINTSITPIWSGVHTFNAGIRLAATEVTTSAYILTSSAKDGSSMVNSTTLASLATNLAVPAPAAATKQVTLAGSAGSTAAGTAYMAYDTGLALSQSIVPEWTGAHAWFNAIPTTKVILTRGASGSSNPYFSLAINGQMGWGSGAEVVDAILTHTGRGALTITSSTPVTDPSSLTVDRLVAGATVGSLGDFSVLLMLENAPSSVQAVKGVDKAALQSWLGTNSVVSHGLGQHSDVDLTVFNQPATQKDGQSLVYNDTLGKWVGSFLYVTNILPTKNGPSTPVLFGARSENVGWADRGREIALGASLQLSMAGESDTLDVVSAPKWAAAMSLTATGEVGGSTSFDGSIAATLALTIDKTRAYSWTGRHTFKTTGAPPSVELSAANLTPLTATTRILGVAFDSSNLAQGVQQFLVSDLATYIGQPTVPQYAVAYGDQNNRLTGIASKLRWDYTAERLGIRNAAPLETVDIIGSFKLTGTTTDSIAPGMQVYAIDTSISTAEWTSRRMYGSIVDARKTGSATFGTSATLYGLSATAGVTAGSVLNIIGVDVQMVFGASSGVPATTNIFGVRTSPTLGGANGTITNLVHFAASDIIAPYPQPQNQYGFYVDQLASASIAVRTAGIYLGILSTGTGQRYNVYAPGTAPSHFAGSIGLGVTYATAAAPTARLEMAVGTTTLAPIRFASTSSSAALLTTPLAGALESRGDRLTFTDTATPSVRHLIAHLDDLSFGNDIAAAMHGGLRMGTTAGDRTESTLVGGAIGTGDFSVNIRMRVSAAPIPATVYGIVGIVSVKGTGTQGDFAISQNTNAITVGWRNAGATLILSSSIDITPYIGTIIDFTVRRTATAETVLINGVKVPGYVPSTSSGSSLANGASTLYLFTGNYTTGILPFHEPIYSFRMWNRALTDGDVTSIIRLGLHHTDQWGNLGGTSGCIIDLDYGGASTLIVPDNSTNNWDATVFGSSEYVAGHLHDVSTIHSRDTNGVPWITSTGRMNADATKMSWSGTRFSAFGEGYFQTAVGAGVTPGGSAYLETQSGSSSKAPLRIPPGTFLTTPTSGCFESDGVRPYFSNNSTPSLRRGLAFVDEFNFTNDPIAQAGGGIAFASATRMTALLDQVNYIGQADFSLWARFRCPTVFRGPTADGICSVSNDQYYQNAARLNIDSSGRLSFVISTTGSNTRTLRTTASVLPLYGGKIMDVVAVRVGAAVPTLYINGILQTNVSETTNSSPPAYDQSIDSKYLIAGMDYTGYSSVPEIYRVALFNYALAISDVVDLCRYGRPDIADSWGVLTASTVANAGFETFTGAVPNSWTKGASVTTADEAVDFHVGTGAHAVKFTGAGAANNVSNTLSQTALAASKRHAIRAWAKRVSGAGPLNIGVGGQAGAALAGSITSAAAYTQFGGYAKATDALYTTLTFAATATDVWLIDDVTLQQVGCIADMDFSIGFGSTVPDRSGRYNGAMTGTYDHLVSKTPLTLASGAGFLTTGVRRYVQRSITLTAQTQVAIAHNLGTKDIAVQVWQDDLPNFANPAKIEVGVQVDSVNQVTLFPATIPTGAKATVVVIG